MSISHNSRRTSLLPLLALGLLASSACKSSDESPSDGTSKDQSIADVSDGATTDQTTDQTTVASTSASESSSEEASSSESTTQSTEETIDDPKLKFDLAIPDFEDQVQSGCEKVDFLFVVDNSGSMEDEQENLAKSFPGFIEGIRTTLQIDDFQILVVDSDAQSSTGSSSCTNNTCTCTPDPDCCQGVCEQRPSATCNGKNCSDIMMEVDCDRALGSGRLSDGAGQDCGLAGGRRYILPDNPDIDGAFACLGKVGTRGDANEKMMSAASQALSTTMVGADGCNEGFIREDAILVVTFITDEEEKPGNGGSPGTPKDWYDAILAAKGGNQDAIVTIGFIGDHGTANPICELPDAMGNGAEPSPLLREFIALFGANGLEASVCAPDFGPAFTEAVSKIDTACQKIDPPYCF